MPRYKLTIEYDGTPFSGWQIQRSGMSVQERLRQAIQSFSGAPMTPRGAGRTDAGVHALGQVAHIDLAKDWPPETVMKALNFHLKPDPIVVLQCESAADDFDARFSAKARHYLYRIVTRPAPPALERGRAWFIRHALDRDAMRMAAQHFVGRHDFTTFRAAGCQAKSPVKTLDAFDIENRAQAIDMRVRARSFLHHQVRSMVGSLKLVGEGKWSPADLQQALEARDRSRCGPLAPACGLYLVRVDY